MAPNGTSGYLGHVDQGVVVLDEDADLPNGTIVRVTPMQAKPLAERLQSVIGIVEDKPVDWAEQHDHYLHGTPKK